MGTLALDSLGINLADPPGAVFAPNRKGRDAHSLPGRSSISAAVLSIPPAMHPASPRPFCRGTRSIPLKKSLTRPCSSAADVTARCRQADFMALFHGHRPAATTAVAARMNHVLTTSPTMPRTILPLIRSPTRRWSGFDRSPSPLRFQAPRNFSAIDRPGTVFYSPLPDGSVRICGINPG